MRVSNTFSCNKSKWNSNETKFRWMKINFRVTGWLLVKILRSFLDKMPSRCISPRKVVHLHLMPQRLQITSFQVINYKFKNFSNMPLSHLIEDRINKGEKSSFSMRLKHFNGVFYAWWYKIQCKRGLEMILTSVIVSNKEHLKSQNKLLFLRCFCVTWSQ